MSEESLGSLGDLVAIVQIYLLRRTGYFPSGPTRIQTLLLAPLTIPSVPVRTSQSSRSPLGDLVTDVLVLSAEVDLPPSLWDDANTSVPPRSTYNTQCSNKNK